MTETKIEIGTIVHHPKRPVWGPGKTLAVGGGGQVTVYFRDLEEEKPGDAVKTISTNVIGLEIAEEQRDSMLENLPVFDNGKFKGQRKPRLSLDQAVAAFIDKQPGVFNDAKYLEDERSAAVDAHKMWVDDLADGQGEKFLDDGNIAEVRKRLLKVDATFSLLRPHEKTALKRGLEEDEFAEPYMRALFAVCAQGEPDRVSYQPLIDAVDLMVEKEQGTRTSNWAVLTQFPFIASPEHHMGLKPPTFQKCAARLNYDIHYTAAPNWWTYDRLLEMSKLLLARLEPLGARDFFDVHSFVGVIATV